MILLQYLFSSMILPAELLLAALLYVSALQHREHFFLRASASGMIMLLFPILPLAGLLQLVPACYMNSLIISLAYAAFSYCNPYSLAVSLADGCVLQAADGSDITDLMVDEKIDLTEAFIPQLENVDLSGCYTGTDGRTLTYASYAPEMDGQQHPLVIWLHGAGDGGTDPSIAVLGNKVTALYGEEFQTMMGGAYVLAPQVDGFWLEYQEGGKWDDNPGTDSLYLHTLMELIQKYVGEHEEIDTDRIYLGGCSNGGYMTMDLVLSYPDYFAAAYPICEAYLDAGITDEQLAAIRNLPIWFVYALNDETVNPETHEIPTVARLQALGGDVHTSVFEDVHDTTGLYTEENGSAHQYQGHWSWLYFFNNECEENGVTLWQWLSEQHR